MSERLLGPDLNSRLAYVPAGGSLLSAAGMSAVVFANSTGSTLADIQIYNGTSTPAGPVPNSTLTVDSDSLIPRFWFPENTDTVYIEVNGGTRTAANADYDFRIGAVGGDVNSPVLSTGVLHGGVFSINALNPKALDISPLHGYIVDYVTDPANPTITPLVTTATTTVVLDAAAQARVITFWLMDATGALIQQANPPTNEQRRTHLQLGYTGYNSTTGSIFAFQDTPIILPQLANQVYDLMYSLSAFSITGNVIAPDGSNLTLTKTQGNIFSVAFSRDITPNNPHVSFLAAQSPVTFRHFSRSLAFQGPYTSILDVANFDNNGTITPVGGGANAATNFRVFALGDNSVANQIVIQYGQDTHSSLSAAVTALRTGNYVVNPTFGRAVALIGFISVIRTATNLSDPAQAVFTRASKFDIP